MQTFDEPIESGTDRHQRLTGFLSSGRFPCVGALSAMNKGRLRWGHFGALGAAQNVPRLHTGLLTFAQEFPEPGEQPVSYVAMFEDDSGGSDEQFERRLWLQLQRLHDADACRFPWDARVGADPARSDFSMSVGGRAYFVVGLHPGASRMARRAPMPCLVFNFHEQFERLKKSGKYAGMQQAVRRREMALQGSINPVLARFGEASEARQYSGRHVPNDWRCPFTRRSSGHGA